MFHYPNTLNVTITKIQNLKQNWIEPLVLWIENKPCPWFTILQFPDIVGITKLLVRSRLSFSDFGHTINLRVLQNIPTFPYQWEWLKSVWMTCSSLALKTVLHETKNPGTLKDYTYNMPKLVCSFNNNRMREIFWSEIRSMWLDLGIIVSSVKWRP